MKTTKKYLASAYYAQGTILVILKSEKKKKSGTYLASRSPKQRAMDIGRYNPKQKVPSNRRKAQRTANGSSNGRNLWRAYGDGTEQKVGSSLIRLEHCILQAAEINLLTIEYNSARRCRDYIDAANGSVCP